MNRKNSSKMSKSDKFFSFSKRKKIKIIIIVNRAKKNSRKGNEL